MTKRVIMYVTVRVEAEMDEATTPDEFVAMMDYDFATGLEESSVIDTEITDFVVTAVV